MHHFKDDGQYAMTTDGVKVYFEVDGADNCIPLLIIPGLGGSEETYNHVADRLQAMYKVIKLDGRGIGLSDRPEGNYTIDMLVDDVIAIVEKLRLTKVNVLGHSLGGFTAQQFYNRCPSLTQSLILVSTNVGYGDSHAVLPPKEDIDQFNRVITPDDPELQQKLLFKTLMCYDQSFVATDQGKQAIAEMTEINLARVVYQSLVRRGSGGWAFKNFDNLSKIAVPVLVIQGKHDRLVPAVNADIFVKHIPNCRKVVFRQCGHHPFVEKLDEFIAVVDQFLQQVNQ